MRIYSFKFIWFQKATAAWYASFPATSPWAPEETAFMTISLNCVTQDKSPHDPRTLLDVQGCVFISLPPVCESVALCSSIKVSSFAFPVIRLIAVLFSRLHLLSERGLKVVRMPPRSGPRRWRLRPCRYQLITHWNRSVLFNYSDW